MSAQDGVTGFLPCPCIDLTATLDGGQAFRWWAEDDGYRGVIGGRVLRLSPAKGGAEVRALDGKVVSPALSTLREYLGLDDDMDALRARHADDEVLTSAVDAHPGLRLLRQDPWECLIGFICSATSNVNRIKVDVASIAKEFGDPIGTGERDYAFPAPADLAEADVGKLRALGLGFHARYVVAAIRRATDGGLNLERLCEMSYLCARAQLTTLEGVGEKIADCVLAFSLGKGEAFPVDRWVRRAMEGRYGLPEAMSNSSMGEWARQHFGQDAAYANQYLFHRERLEGGQSGH